MSTTNPALLEDYIEQLIKTAALHLWSTGRERLIWVVEQAHAYLDHAVELALDGLQSITTQDLTDFAQRVYDRIKMWVQAGPERRASRRAARREGRTAHAVSGLTPGVSER